METEKISIIIPIYQAEKVLNKCMDSIIHQTYKNIEIIAILDGCTDESENIIKKYASLDNRIKWFSRENKGALFSRIEGVNLATGTYLTFVDCDDWIDLDMIEILYNEISKNEVDIVKCCATKEFIEEKRTRLVSSPFKSDIIIQENEKKNLLYPAILETYFFNSMCMQLIKTKVIRNIAKTENIDFKIKMGEDLKFNLFLYTEAKSIEIILNPMYHYRANSSSVTMNKTYQEISKKIEDTYFVYSSLLDQVAVWKLDKTVWDEKVKNRTIDEIIKVFSAAFKANSTVSRTDKKKLKEQTANFLKQEHLNDNCKNNKIAYMILNKQFFKLKYYLFFKITIIDFIKKQLKNLLAMRHKTK